MITGFAPTIAAVAMFTLVADAGCGRHAIAVEFYLVNGYHFSEAERRSIQAIADEAVQAIRPHLPGLPRDLTLKVYSGTDVDADTGEGTAPRPPKTVLWTVDPARAGGVEATARRELRGTLFHHLYHLVRAQTVPMTPRLLDNVVAEGLATAFERDAGGHPRPWAAYPADAAAWVDELRAVPADAPLDSWLIKHPDGRRWVGIRAGTYLVDRALARSSHTAASLVAIPTNGLLRLAGVEPPPPPAHPAAARRRPLEPSITIR